MLPPLLRTRLHLLLPQRLKGLQRNQLPVEEAKIDRSKEKICSLKHLQVAEQGRTCGHSCQKSGKGKEARQTAKSGTGEETRQVCPVEEDVKEEADNRDDEDMGQAQNALEEGQWDALK